MQTSTTTGTAFGELRPAALRRAGLCARPHRLGAGFAGREVRTAHGLTVSAEWANLQSSLITRLKGIERTSTVIEGLKATVVSSHTGQTINVDAARTEIHLRQNGGDLDGAISVDGFQHRTCKDLAAGLPALSASADADARR